MATNTGRFTDRNPDIAAAGKLVASGDKASECLETQKEDTISPTIKKFYDTTQPEPGKARIFHGKADDSKIADTIVHGVNTRPSLVAGCLVTPQPKTSFSQRLLDKKETVYSSRKKAPLGKSPDQRPGLPEGVGLYDVRYGIPTIKEGKASDIVNPPKSREQVESEGNNSKDLYKVSHHAYEVGEAYDRQYNWNKVPKSSIFGVETPHNNDGIHVKKSLKWLYNTQIEKASHIVSKRVDDFRERTQPQLGKVHDPIKDTMNVPPDHIYGVLFKPDEYGAGDLIHGRVHGEYLQGKDNQRAILAAVRQHLKKSNYHKFNDIKSAFEYYDKDNSGKINISELHNVCEDFKLPVEEKLLDALISYCDTDDDKQIDYQEFANFLNWEGVWQDALKVKQDVTEEIIKEDSMQGKSGEEKDAPKPIRQIDKAIGGWKTSASTINATVGRIKTKDWKLYGVPTIRSDLAAPRIRRISDRTNYGDESDAYGLINPSMYSNHGVYEKDFFQARSQNELHRVIDSTGIRMTADAFDALWQKAASQHPQGLVSVNSFKNALDDLNSNEFNEAKNMQEV